MGASASGAAGTRASTATWPSRLIATSSRKRGRAPDPASSWSQGSMSNVRDVGDECMEDGIAARPRGVATTIATPWLVEHGQKHPLFCLTSSANPRSFRSTWVDARPGLASAAQLWVHFERKRDPRHETLHDTYRTNRTGFGSEVVWARFTQCEPARYHRVLSVSACFIHNLELERAHERAEALTRSGQPRSASLLD